MITGEIVGASSVVTSVGTNAGRSPSVSAKRRTAAPRAPLALLPCLLLRCLLLPCLLLPCLLKISRVISRILPHVQGRLRPT